MAKHKIHPLKITAYTLTSALGKGCQDTLFALREQRTGLRRNDFLTQGPNTWIGRVDAIDTVRLEGHWAPFDCRNNRLAAIGLEHDHFEARCAQARQRYGASQVGLFMATSTSGIEQTESAYLTRPSADAALPEQFDYFHTGDLFSLTDFVGKRLGLTGPALTLSTACSSSAKAFATAWRYINAGFCKAAVVGGVDSLCRMTLHGFDALQLLSPQPCRPMDPSRTGISIGESAAFVLLEPVDEAGLSLLGYGESNDAFHMSSPDPTGAGAAMAMQAALDRSGLSHKAIDFIHLHGTATLANDSADDKAINQVFGPLIPCASTKGWTGHTLGAAGATSVVISALCLENNWIPGTLNTLSVDPMFASNVLLDPQETPLKYVMNNAFGFGGTNAALILGKPS